MGIKYENFRKRLNSSFFLLLILLLILASNFFFYFIIQIIFFLSIWELLRLNRFSQNRATYTITDSNFILTRTKIKIIDYFLLISFGLIFLLFSLTQSILLIWFFLGINLISFLLRLYSSKIILCLFYFSIPFFLLAYYRNTNYFDLFFLFMISFTIVTDVGAYIFGTYFGGKKMLMSISPNKTYSGLIGGTIMPMVFAFLFYNQHPYLMFIFTCIILSLSVQLGDLLVSFLKRKFGVKDSSNLIPGHGGVLDRLDGFFLLIIVVSILNVLGFNFFFMI